MAGRFAIASTAIVTAVLTSAGWIFYFNIAGSPVETPARPIDQQVAGAGDKDVIKVGNAPPVTVAEAVEVGPAGLAIPVQSVRPDQLVDTFTQARAGGRRVHDAIDIMAAEGTPVLAAAPGVVEKLYFSKGGGGTTVYVRSPDRAWSYYYAHLKDYAPGLEEGQQVQRGQLLGFVGHTGNANPAGPHLHFAINRMSAGDRWWQGAPVNPYPLLVGRQVKG